MSCNWPFLRNSKLLKRNHVIATMILQTNIYIVKQSKTQHTEKIVQYPDIFMYLIRTRYSITAWNGYKYGGFSGLYFFPYLFQIRDNMDHKKLHIWTLYTQWFTAAYYELCWCVVKRSCAIVLICFIYFHCFRLMQQIIKRWLKSCFLPIPKIVIATLMIINSSSFIRIIIV